MRAYGEDSLEELLEEFSSLTAGEATVIRPGLEELGSGIDLDAIAGVLDVPAVAAASSAVLVRVAALLQTWLEGGTKRTVEVVRPDGSKIRVEGSDANLETVLDALGKSDDSEDEAESQLPT